MRHHDRSHSPIPIFPIFVIVLLRFAVSLSLAGLIPPQSSPTSTRAPVAVTRNQAPGAGNGRSFQANSATVFNQQDVNDIHRALDSVMGNLGVANQPYYASNGPNNYKSPTYNFAPPLTNFDSDDDDSDESGPLKSEETTGGYPPILPPHDDKEHMKNHEGSPLGVALGVSLGLGIPALLAIGVALYYCLVWKKKMDRLKMVGSSCAVGVHKKYANDYEKGGPFYKGSDAHNDDIWQMDSSSVIINYDSKLGSGAFCNVYKGEIIGEAAVCKANRSIIATAAFRDCKCAVKMLPSFADDIAKSDFAQEINFMKSLHYHPHLVSMLGWVPDPKSPMLVVEFCAQGDLLHFIRANKQDIITGYENEGTGVKIKDLVSFSWQTSNGLEYLSATGCIHRDIAARNVLVDSSNVCKIGDFGLCRLSDCHLYTGRGGRLPLKWMAPESLRSYEYSLNSDVWSYGILLYEVFSLGQVPYALMQTSELLEYLDAGNRLTRPQYCPKEIYSIMLDCWKQESALRPSFTDICSALRVILENAAENYGYVTAIGKDPPPAVPPSHSPSLSSRSSSRASSPPPPSEFNNPAVVASVDSENKS